MQQSTSPTSPMTTAYHHIGHLAIERDKALTAIACEMTISELELRGLSRQVAEDLLFEISSGHFAHLSFHRIKKFPEAASCFGM